MFVLSTRSLINNKDYEEFINSGKTAKQSIGLEDDKGKCASLSDKAKSVIQLLKELMQK